MNVYSTPWQLFCIKSVSSVKCRLLINQPWIENNSLFHHHHHHHHHHPLWCFRHGIGIKINEDNGLPCFVPRVCLNHSPTSLPNLSAAFAFWYNFWRTLISLASTLYDFNTVHNHILLYGVICILEVYKTTILYFPFPVSFLQLACVRICWIVPLSTVSLEREI